MKNLKQVFGTLRIKASDQPLAPLAPPDPSTSHPEVEQRRVVWPPKLIHQTPMGYLRDSSGNYLPRDIGRSSILGDGTVIFQFGDTFCHSMDGKFIGLTTNNASVCDAVSNPTVSSYFTIKDSITGDRDSEHPVPASLKFFPEESDTETHFLKLWCFSGIVETCFLYTGSRYGVCYYEARKIKKEADPMDDGLYLYTGNAIVKWNPTDRCLEATRVYDDTYGMGPQLFTAEEPRFGSFCAVAGVNKDYIYLYGHSTAPEGSKSIVLARVLVEGITVREAHEYWDGSGWSSNMGDCKAVFGMMQHGQVFVTDMFGLDSAVKYAFIGCNAFADSKVQFGRAISPEGPWDIQEVKGLRTYSMQPHDPAPFKYCFYPHPWAFKTARNGDLLITWSEGGMNGGVIAELLRFETTV